MEEAGRGDGTMGAKASFGVTRTLTPVRGVINSTLNAIELTELSALQLILYYVTFISTNRKKEKGRGSYTEKATEMPRSMCHSTQEGPEQE